MKGIAMNNKVVKNKSAYQIVKYMSLAGLIVAFSTQASLAATNPQPVANNAAKVAPAKAAAKTVTAKAATTATKPAVKVIAAAPKAAAKPVVSNQMANKVTTKTSTGKTITYDCSKAGNKNKKACHS